MTRWATLAWNTSSSSSITYAPLRGDSGGQPSRGLPTDAHADVDKRERRLVSLTFASWNHIQEWVSRIEWLRKAA